MESYEHRSGAADTPRASATGGAGAEVLSESPLFSSPTDFIASLFPLLVLAVCVSAISSSTAPSSGFSLLQPASVLHALRLHLAVLRHHAPTRIFSSATLSPPFLISVVLPFVSFFVFRVLPLVVGGGSPHEPLPALAFSVSYPALFSLPATAASDSAGLSFPASSSTPTGRPHLVLHAIAYIASLVGFHQPEQENGADGAERPAAKVAAAAKETPSALHVLSPLLRLLLHPAYLSRRSVMFWLLGGPLLLYSCVLHIYLHHRDAALTSAAAAAADVSGPSPQVALRCYLNVPRPTLRATAAVAVCLLLPSVIAAATLHWFADPDKGTEQAFQYVGIEGAMYALAFLVVLYDPVTHGGMFSNARLQYAGPFHVRDITSILTFVVFLFSPPPFDLFLLFGGILSAGLAAGAAAAPPPLTLFSCITITALLHPALLSRYGSILPYLLWSSDDGRSWSAGGLALTITIAAVVAGFCWNWTAVTSCAERLTYETQKTRGRIAALVVLTLFVLVPFSYTRPPSFWELLLRPRQTVWSHGGRSLYDVTCNGTTALGSVAAKVIAYWLPVFILQGSNGRVKYIVGPLSCLLLFIGMEMERWDQVGPHIVFPLLSLYLLFTLKCN